jgi:aminoglycoside phosphotransferase (APT) family kinase protein
MKQEETYRQIKKIILDRGWLETVEKVSFLAAGEYNENYVVASKDHQYVFRINHGSQINQQDQIRYEYHVLRTVAPSGVTPAVFQVDSDTALGGVLLMAFIEGRPFDFQQDLSAVPGIFAAIHSLPQPQQHVEPDLAGKSLPPLICQADPVGDIARESIGLINRFANHPLKKEKSDLLAYHEQILTLGQTHGALFDEESLCIVNTEVNSGNFIIRGTKGFLVDWEKAVISCRYQDLAHFIIPTTTLWKSDFRFTPDQRIHFLKQYYDLILPEVSFETLAFKTALLEKTILLRALSWCFMAWYEYTDSQRTLTHNTTFNKIKHYLENLECFLK